MSDSKRFVIGTIAQLVGKLALNGTVLDQPALSVMTRVFEGSIFKQVGTIRKEGERGRPAAIWSVDLETAAFFNAGHNSIDLQTDDLPLVAKIAASA